MEPLEFENFVKEILKRADSRDLLSAKYNMYLQACSEEDDAVKKEMYDFIRGLIVILVFSNKDSIKMCEIDEAIKMLDERVQLTYIVERIKAAL